MGETFAFGPFPRRYSCATVCLRVNDGQCNKILIKILRAEYCGDMDGEYTIRSLIDVQVTARIVLDREETVVMATFLVQTSPIGLSSPIQSSEPQRPDETKYVLIVTKNYGNLQQRMHPNERRNQPCQRGSAEGKKILTATLCLPLPAARAVSMPSYHSCTRAC